MDNGPDREEDDLTRTDTPVTRPEPSGPPTDRVRIVGAETAAEITSELPVVPPEENEPEETESPSVRILDKSSGTDTAGVEPVVPGQTAVPAGGAAPTELPHWTEPPTGQVPAVLAREPEEGSGTGVLPPSWREEDADWIAHEEEFDPAMFSTEHTTLGSLDETHGTDAERRPWEFDLGSVRPGAAEPGLRGPDRRACRRPDRRACRDSGRGVRCRGRRPPGRCRPARGGEPRDPGPDGGLRRGHRDQ